MNNYELHEQCEYLSDTYTPYQLAKIVITLQNEVEQLEQVVRELKQQKENSFFVKPR